MYPKDGQAPQQQDEQQPKPSFTLPLQIQP